MYVILLSFVVHCLLLWLFRQEAEKLSKSILPTTVLPPTAATAAAVAAAEGDAENNGEEAPVTMDM